MVELKREIKFDFLWDRRPFHKRYLNLYDTCRLFSQLYSRGISKEKNERISKFYCEIAKECGIRRNKLSLLREFLKIVTKELSDWEFFVQKREVSPREARRLVYTSQGLTIEEEALLTKTTGFEFEFVEQLITKGLTKKQSERIMKMLHLDRDTFNILKKKTLNTVKKEFKLVSKLRLNFKRYIEVIEADLTTIEGYYEREGEITKMKPRRDIEMEVINKGNLDFFIYNHILYNLIRESDIRGDIKLVHHLDNFLKQYLDLLFIANEIKNIERDLKNKEFNLLIWMNSCVEKERTKKNFHEQFISNRVYDFIIKVVDDTAQKAYTALMDIEKENLQNLLKKYLDGLIEGLDIYTRHEYLRNYDHAKRLKIKELVLNPHPWERIKFKDVFRNEERTKQRAIKMIDRVRKNIKKEADRRDPSYRPGQYNSISSAESRLLAAKTRRCILPLRSKGCSWAFERKGPCNICGIRGDNLWNRRIADKAILEQFNKDSKEIDFKTHSILAVYCNGSFLDEEELSSRAKSEILKIISKEKGVKRVDFETRPEFVKDSKIKKMKKLLGRKILEISMGFDEVDEDIRNLIVNKGMKREDIEKAIKILIKNHVNTLVYVGVKPPFLTEKEAIQEAIDTIEYLFRIGVEQISLEPITVQDYTLTKYLYDNGLYRPAWLWSIIEILRATHSKINAPMIGPERIGGFVFFPLPKVVAHNCPKCDKKVIKAIKKFESIQDIRVFDELTCSCKKQWEKEMERAEPPLYERIVKTLQKAG